MIRTLMHIDWINLKRDRVALGLTSRASPSKTMTQRYPLRSA